MVASLVRFAVLGAMGAMVLGCGQGASMSPVSGKITYNKQPVAGATVTFVPENGPVATGTTDANGEYKLTTTGQPGAIRGKHRVSVTKSSATAAIPNATPEDMIKLMKDGKMPVAKPELPGKYGAPQTSGFQAEVTADKSKNVFNFDLTD